MLTIALFYKNQIIDTFAFIDTSGFISTNTALSPLSNGQDTSYKELTLPNPKIAKVIIYNHGTSNSYRKENCTNWWAQPSHHILNQRNKNTYVYFLCSKVTDWDKPTSYTARRSAEIESLIDTFIAQGLQPQNIYLAGQSAGAWAILRMSKQAKKKFNSFFLFSPACCGTTAKQAKRKAHNIWNTLHTKELALFNTLPQKGIIFTYADDPYMTQKNFTALKKYKTTIKFYEYNCGLGHGSNRKGCKTKVIESIIRHHINNN